MLLSLMVLGGRRKDHLLARAGDHWHHQEPFPGPLATPAPHRSLPQWQLTLSHTTLHLPPPGALSSTPSWKERLPKYTLFKSFRISSGWTCPITNYALYLQRLATFTGDQSLYVLSNFVLVRNSWTDGPFEDRKICMELFWQGLASDDIQLIGCRKSFWANGRNIVGVLFCKIEHLFTL